MSAMWPTILAAILWLQGVKFYWLSDPFCWHSCCEPYFNISKFRSYFITAVVELAVVWAVNAKQLKVSALYYQLYWWCLLMLGDYWEKDRQQSYLINVFPPPPNKVPLPILYKYWTLLFVNISTTTFQFEIYLPFSCNSTMMAQSNWWCSSNVPRDRYSCTLPFKMLCSNLPQITDLTSVKNGSVSVG